MNRPVRALKHGWCVLGRHWEMVLFLGPAEAEGQSAPVHACEACCAYLRDFVRCYNRQLDAGHRVERPVHTLTP